MINIDYKIHLTTIRRLYVIILLSCVDTKININGNVDYKLQVYSLQQLSYSVPIND